ncbi:uncharacterized protein RCC_09010 [Ramularia collo-cygni]|uniref:Uncharacterized protein n=1 Tax=Ramularia collo-cygni TaxID=112498 RepID=A0A2D3VJ44_9PEZI|nr:uncharacterized protein RCC_09010 [Ramularia collo-cygni]CZT23299.1 uncharacterized protein RCC_09010 [Ramularia collo-cygni]
MPHLHLGYGGRGRPPPGGRGGARGGFQPRGGGRGGFVGNGGTQQGNNSNAGPATTVGLPQQGNAGPVAQAPVRHICLTCGLRGHLWWDGTCAGPCFHCPSAPYGHGLERCPIAETLGGVYPAKVEVRVPENHAAQMEELRTQHALALVKEVAVEESRLAMLLWIKSAAERAGLGPAAPEVPSARSQPEMGSAAMHSVVAPTGRKIAPLPKRKGMPCESTATDEPGRAHRARRGGG